MISLLPDTDVVRDVVCKMVGCFCNGQISNQHPCVFTAQPGKEPSNAAKEAERVRQDKRQFVKAASTFQIRDWSAKTKPIHLYRRLADEHMVSSTVAFHS